MIFLLKIRNKVKLYYSLYNIIINKLYCYSFFYYSSFSLINAKYKNDFNILNEIYKYNFLIQQRNINSLKINYRGEEIRCTKEAATQQKNVSSAKSSSLEENSAPMQEVFLPSRWSGAEMKISHLNFFTRRPIRRG